MRHIFLSTLALGAMVIPARAELGVIDFEEAKGNVQNWEETYMMFGACRQAVPDPRRALLVYWKHKGASDNQLTALSGIMTETAAQFRSYHMQALQSNLTFNCSRAQTKDAAEFKARVESDLAKSPTCGEHNGKIFCE